MLLCDVSGDPACNKSFACRRVGVASSVLPRHREIFSLLCLVFGFQRSFPPPIPFLSHANASFDRRILGRREPMFGSLVAPPSNLLPAPKLARESKEERTTNKAGKPKRRTRRNAVGLSTPPALSFLENTVEHGAKDGCCTSTPSVRRFPPSHDIKRTHRVYTS